MKKIFLLFALLNAWASADAQTAQITAKMLRATEILQLRNRPADSIVVSIDGSSTDRQLPSAKAVYDYIGGLTFGHKIAQDASGVADRDTLDFTTGGDVALQIINTATATQVQADLNANVVDSTKIINGGVSVLDLGQHGATSGQVLKWNGTQWAPGDDSTPAITANEVVYGSGTGVTSDTYVKVYSGNPSNSKKMEIDCKNTSYGLLVDNVAVNGIGIEVIGDTATAASSQEAPTVLYGRNQQGDGPITMVLENNSGSGSNAGAGILLYPNTSGSGYINFNRPGTSGDYIIGATTGNVFSINAGNTLNTSGLVLNISNEAGIGGSPVASRALTVTGVQRITSGTGTPTNILGRDASGDVNNLTLGAGLSLSSGTLSVSGTGHVIAGDGAAVTQRDTLNFVSSSTITASVADATTKSNVTLSVPTGGIGTTQILDGSVSSTDVDTTISNHLLPDGTNKYTLRHNGTSWAAASNLQNDGTSIGVGIVPDNTYGRFYLQQSGSTDGIGVINSGASGRIRMYHTSNTGYLKTDVYNMNIESAGQLSIYGPGGGGQTQQIFLSALTNVTTATGNASLMRFGSTYAPTAAGGDFSFMKFLPAINMTSSANQTVYCMDFNPTITSLNTGSLIGINYRPSVGSFIYQTTGTSVASHLIGNLGLGTGTTSPAAKLHIVGNGSTSSTFEQETFNSSDSIVLAVRDDRRVGVNTSAPAEALDVIGQARVDALDIRNWSGSSNTKSGQVQYHDGSGGTYSAYLTVGAGERRFALMPYVIQLQAVDYNVDWTTGRTKAFWTVPERFTGWKVSKVYMMVSSIGSVTGNTVDIEKNGSNLGTQTISSSDHTMTLDTSISTGDIFTFNITGTGATASKGLYVEIELRYQ